MFFPQFIPITRRIPPRAHILVCFAEYPRGSHPTRCRANGRSSSIRLITGISDTTDRRRRHVDPRPLESRVTRVFSFPRKRINSLSCPWPLYVTFLLLHRCHLFSPRRFGEYSYFFFSPFVSSVFEERSVAAAVVTQRFDEFSAASHNERILCRSRCW